MKADLVAYNGDIHTMDAAVPQAQAIAIAGNRILAVGQDSVVRALLVPQGQALDLRGRTVVPGFIDAHTHFMSYGFGLREIDLAQVPTLEEALARVAARAQEIPNGQWLVGRGWDQTLWAGGNFPTRQDLDRVAGNHPVFLRRRCGHAGWANSQALALAGITAETPDPPGGEIVRDPDTGQPTGVLLDMAMDLVFNLFDEPTVDDTAAAIKGAMPDAHRHGIVGLHEMEPAAAFRAYQKLRDEGELKLRVSFQTPESDLDAAIQTGLRTGLGDELLRFGGVKLYADGALGAHTAYMLEPYDNQPDNYGLPLADAEHLKAVIGKASRAGIATFTHAIGDRANREVLDAIEAAQKAGWGLNLRHRIEHAQLLHADDLPRLAQLGVIPCMQPIQVLKDMLMAEAFWGARCASGAYAYRSLLDSGAVLAFSSDTPVEVLDVMQGIHGAVARHRADGPPGPEGPNGWYPEERITVDEAVYAYTAGAAYSTGEEAIKGTLAPGKLADLAVLSQNIFAIDPVEILDTEVVATLFDGEFVYAQEGVLSWPSKKKLPRP